MHLLKRKSPICTHINARTTTSISCPRSTQQAYSAAEEKVMSHLCAGKSKPTKNTPNQQQQGAASTPGTKEGARFLEPSRNRAQRGFPPPEQVKTHSLREEEAGNRWPDLSFHPPISCWCLSLGKPKQMQREGSLGDAECRDQLEGPKRGQTKEDRNRRGDGAKRNNQLSIPNRAIYQLSL